MPTSLWLPLSTDVRQPDTTSRDLSRTIQPTSARTFSNQSPAQSVRVFTWSIRKREGCWRSGASVREVSSNEYAKQATRWFGQQRVAAVHIVGDRGSRLDRTRGDVYLVAHRQRPFHFAASSFGCSNSSGSLAILAAMVSRLAADHAIYRIVNRGGGLPANRCNGQFRAGGK
jgi:hypothetical protein